MAIVLVEAPAKEPVTVDEAMLHARCTNAREQALFRDVLVPAARQRAELETQRQLISATYALWLDAWPEAGWIDVPRPPLRSVTSITYADTTGTWQTLATSAYVVEAPDLSRPHAPRGRIHPAYNTDWPSVRSQPNAVKVTFVAGYGDEPAHVPPHLRLAILRDVAHLYAQREDVVVGAISGEVPRSSARVYRAFKSRPRQGRAA